MSIIKDKYQPKQIDDFMLNKKHISFYNNYFSDYIINTVIYGRNGVGKYTLCKCILYNIYGNEISNMKKITMKIQKNNNTKEIDIYASKYHYEILLNSYICNDKVSILKLINRLAETKNVSTNDLKVILIKNADELLHNNNTFKNIIEKYSNTCRFLITVNSISKISKALTSFFMCIRIPTPKYNDIFNLVKYIANEEKYLIKDNEIHNLIIKSENNINKLLIFLEISFATGEYVEYKDEINEKIDNLVTLILSNKSNNIEKIRKSLYEITSKNISKKYLFNTIYKRIQNKIKNTNILIKIVECIALYNHRSTISYRDIIHLEACLINIMNIISL